MAFKSTNSGATPAEAFPRSRQIAAQLKNDATIQRDRANGGSLLASDYMTFIHSMADSRDELAAAAGIAGIDQYAKDQYDDPLYDVGAAFAEILAEIDELATWSETNFPVDAEGFLQIRKFIGDGTGRSEDVAHTDLAALTAVANRLDALIATID